MRLSQWNKCRAWNNIPRLILRNFNLQLFPRLYIRCPYNIFVSFKSFMRSVNDGQELLGWLIGIINKAWNIEQFPRILKPILKHWNKICLSGNTKYIYIVIYIYIVVSFIVLSFHAIYCLIFVTCRPLLTPCIINALCMQRSLTFYKSFFHNLFYEKSIVSMRRRTTYDNYPLIFLLCPLLYFTILKIDNAF